MSWEALTWLIAAVALVLCCVSMFAMMARSNGSALRSARSAKEGQKGAAFPADKRAVK